MVETITRLTTGPGDVHELLFLKRSRDNPVGQHTHLLVPLPSPYKTLDSGATSRLRGSGHPRPSPRVTPHPSTEHYFSGLSTSDPLDLPSVATVTYEKGPKGTQRIQSITNFECSSVPLSRQVSRTWSVPPGFYVRSVHKPGYLLFGDVRTDYFSTGRRRRTVPVSSLSSYGRFPHGLYRVLREGTTGDHRGCGSRRNGVGEDG